MTKLPAKQIIQMAIAGKVMVPGNAVAAQLVQDAPQHGFVGEQTGDGPSTLSIIGNDVERIVRLDDVKAIFLAPSGRGNFEEMKWNLKYWRFHGQYGFMDGVKRGIVFVDPSAPVTIIRRSVTTAGRLSSTARGRSGKRRGPRAFEGCCYADEGCCYGDEGCCYGDEGCCYGDEGCCYGDEGCCYGDEGCCYGDEGCCYGDEGCCYGDEGCCYGDG